MLRVALDVTPLVGPPTGIHQHTTHLSAALARRDDVELSGWLLSARGDRPTFPGPIKRSRIPASVAARTWARSRWPGRRLIAGDADIVHGINFLGPPDPSTVLTVHDLTPLTHRDTVAPAVASKARAIRHAIDEGAWAHVPSEAVADELRHLTGSDRVRTIVHGLAEAPPHTRWAGRAVVGLDRYVVVVGSTEHRKRVDMVVRAVAELPADVGLAVVGPPGPAEPVLDATITATGMTDRVRRLSGLDDATRHAVVADAEALVLSSRYEGFAFTPLEALRAGVPVASTAVGALPELIGDHIDLVDPDSPDMLDAVAAAVAADEIPAAVRERLAALTWEQTAAAMVELYRDAASS